MDLTASTPREIDTELFRVYVEAQEAARKISLVTADMHHIAKDRKGYGRGARWGMSDEEAADKTRQVAASGGINASRAQRALDSLAAAEKKVDDLNAEAAPLNAEFTRRGGWPRFFLVTNSNGHIHRSMSCSTCRPTTQYAWLPEMSGKSEDEALAELAEGGAILCSVCFPSAPVEWTRKRDADDVCPGSGTADYDRETARIGFAAGNYGTCNHCGKNVTLNKGSWLLRKHKA